MKVTQCGRPTILFVDHTTQLGGGEIALFNLVTTLNPSACHPVFVLPTDGPLVQRLRDAGIEVHVLPLMASVVNARKDTLGIQSILRVRHIFALLAYSVRLAAFARRCKARLIHTNSLKADIYGGIAGKLAGIPVLWHIRDHIDGDYLPERVARAFRFLARILPKAIVANSESTLAKLNIAGKNAAVIYSGVAHAPDASVLHVVHDGVAHDYDLLAKPKSQQTQSRSSVVGIVGRIAFWKGQHIFIKAAAEVLKYHPTTSFWIVGAPLFGEDDYERSLHALVQELGISKQVKFLGFRNDVPVLVTKMDILVHASVLGEPFGQVIVEGMAAGKPVIASHGGAIPEIVVPGETGLTFPMGDDAALGRAILSLLDCPANMGIFGEAGRERVAAHFTIDQAARKIEDIYSDLLGPRHGSKADRTLSSYPSQGTDSDVYVTP